MPGYPVPYKKLRRLKRKRRKPASGKPPLSVHQILAWADEWHARCGRWPTIDCGKIPGAVGESWNNVNAALSQGLRGLPTRGSSLARLLAKHRGVRNPSALPPYTERMILDWADCWRRRTGKWPTSISGTIPFSAGDTWQSVNRALHDGLRGLPGGSSLAQLLHQHRGVRHQRLQRRFSVPEILSWAEAHRAHTGKWPSQYSGSIPEAPGDTWHKVQTALRVGLRGLPGGSSLAQLLLERRKARNPHYVPHLTETQILAWADEHFRRTGAWPRYNSGLIKGTNGEKWCNIDAALGQGLRGLAGGASVAKLLFVHRGVRSPSCLPRLTEKQILAWADAHHARHGCWPLLRSGAIQEAPGETWNAVNHALFEGKRGLPGGMTLARLLEKKRGKPHHLYPPPLSEKAVLGWADRFHQRHGRWPVKTSGPIPEAPPDVRWETVDRCLRDGSRGLPGGSSLALLLEQERGRPHFHHVAPFSIPEILKWADQHHARTGRWPVTHAGAIPAAPHESWQKVNAALVFGSRGLPGGSSLAQLLSKHRNVWQGKERLNIDTILGWIRRHKKRTGRWPTCNDGAVSEAKAETWKGIDTCLRDGYRGLPAGSSLARLIQERLEN